MLFLFYIKCRIEKLRRSRRMANIFEFTGESTEQRIETWNFCFCFPLG